MDTEVVIEVVGEGETEAQVESVGDWLGVRVMEVEEVKVEDRMADMLGVEVRQRVGVLVEQLLRDVVGHREGEAVGQVERVENWLWVLVL